jgi:hypothetical protein
MEIARFRTGQVAGANSHEEHQAMARLKRKIAESERCIAAYERRTKRPLATDLQSLAGLRWSSWHVRSLAR